MFKLDMIADGFAFLGIRKKPELAFEPPAAIIDAIKASLPPDGQIHPYAVSPDLLKVLISVNGKLTETVHIQKTSNGFAVWGDDPTRAFDVTPKLIAANENA